MTGTGQVWQVGVPLGMANGPALRAWDRLPNLGHPGKQKHSSVISSPGVLRTVLDTYGDTVLEESSYSLGSSQHGSRHC